MFLCSYIWYYECKTLPKLYFYIYWLHNICCLTHFNSFHHSFTFYYTNLNNSPTSLTSSLTNLTVFSQVSIFSFMHSIGSFKNLICCQHILLVDSHIPLCHISYWLPYWLPLTSHITNVVVVVVDPTPPTCCQQSPAPESCGSQQSLPPRWQGRAPLCRDSSRGPG